MYIACRDLKLDGGKLARAGEPVDVSQWPYPALIAHINLEWIKEVPDEVPTQPAPVAQKKKNKHRR